MAGNGPNGELAYSRCASWEQGNIGALGQEGSVGCANRFQRKFGRGHDTRHNGRLLYLLYVMKHFV